MPTSPQKTALQSPAAYLFKPGWDDWGQDEALPFVSSKDDDARLDYWDPPAFGHTEEGMRLASEAGKRYAAAWLIHAVCSQEPVHLYQIAAAQEVASDSSAPGTFWEQLEHYFRLFGQGLSQAAIASDIEATIAEEARQYLEDNAFVLERRAAGEKPAVVSRSPEFLTVEGKYRWKRRDDALIKALVMLGTNDGAGTGDALPELILAPQELQRENSLLRDCSARFALRVVYGYSGQNPKGWKIRAGDVLIVDAGVRSISPADVLFAFEDNEPTLVRLKDDGKYALLREDDEPISGDLLVIGPVIERRQIGGGQ